MSALMRPDDALEGAMVSLLKGWLLFQEAHQAAYGSGIGDDGVLGPLWEAIGRALRELLNGDLGRLDGGTLDSLLLSALTAEGFEEG